MNKQEYVTKIQSVLKNPKAVWAGVGGLVLFQALYVTCFVLSEKTIYFWDHAMYLNMARSLFYAFGVSADVGWAQVGNSLASNYAALFALPSMVTFDWFGQERIVFILTNFVCYVLPQEVAMAWILKNGMGWRWGKALCVTGAGLLCVPAFWVPLLQGYPDNAAACCLMIAFALVVLPARSILKACGFGLLLGLTVLLRRHYAYSVATLGVVSFVFDYVTLKERNLGTIGRVFRFYIFGALVLVGGLFFGAKPYLMNMVSVNYNELYQSYRVEGGAFLVHALDGFGILLTATSVFGLGLLIRQKNALALRAVWWMGVWLLVWCVGPAQLGPHYVLQILPLGALIGLAGCLSLYEQNAKARKTLACVGLAIVACGYYAGWGAQEGVMPIWKGTPTLWAAPRPPIIRNDYDELVALARFMKEEAQKDDRVLVVGSSFLFNQDILRAVYTDVLNEPESYAPFFQAPEIDTVQEPPYDVMGAATLFIVPDMAQYHLDPEGQKVVTAAAQFFPPRAPFDKNLARVGRSFKLGQNVNVQVWRRMKPWTPDQAHEMMDLVRRATKDEHVLKIMVMMERPVQAVSGFDEKHNPVVQALFSNEQKDLRVVGHMPLPVGKFVFRAAIQKDPRCDDLRSTLRLKDLSGAVLFEKEMVPEGEWVKQEIDVKEGAQTFIDIGLHAETKASCGALLGNIHLEQRIKS